MIHGDPIRNIGDFEEPLAPKQPPGPPPADILRRWGKEEEPTCQTQTLMAQLLAGAARQSSDCTFLGPAPKRSVTCGRQDCEWKFHKTLRGIVKMCSVIIDAWLQTSYKYPQDMFDTDMLIVRRCLGEVSGRFREHVGDLTNMATSLH